MKRSKSLLALLLICALLLPALAGCGSTTKSAKIGIAWSPVAGSEFVANIRSTLEEMKIDYVMLGQVETAMIAKDDDTGNFRTSCLNEDGSLAPYCADLLPEATDSDSNAATVLADVRGVIFVGNEPISPSLYGFEAEPHSEKEDRTYDAVHDVSDYLLMKYCLDHDLPILALGRGMQLLSVLSGAALLPDLAYYFNDKGASYDFSHRYNLAPGSTYRDYTAHDVTVTDRESLLYSFCKSDVLQGAPSWHCSAVLNVEDTALKVTGVTETCGENVIEAVERTDKTFAMGLQFHPEAAVVKSLTRAKNADNYLSKSTAEKLFRGFADACK